MLNSGFSKTLPFLTFRSQCGVVLLEALIGIMVFSFGVISIIGLQAASIKNSADAKYRADAAFLASEIIGRMWVDSRANLGSYSYKPSANCDPDGVVAAGNTNVVAWLGSGSQDGTVLRTLPNAGARIEISGSRVTVTLCWRPVTATAADPTNSYVTYARIDG